MCRRNFTEHDQPRAARDFHQEFDDHRELLPRRVFVGELVERSTLACGRAIKICLESSWCSGGIQDRAKVHIESDFCWGRLALLRLAVNEQNADLAWLRDDEPLINHFHFRYCSVEKSCLKVYRAIELPLGTYVCGRCFWQALQSLDHAFTSPRSTQVVEFHNKAAICQRVQDVFKQNLQVPLIFSSRYQQANPFFSYDPRG